MTFTELNEIKKSYKVLELAVDFINPSYNISRAKHLDNSRYILCTLTENGIPRSVKTNEVARIRLQKPDKTYVYNECDVLEDGRVLITLTEQILAVEGNAVCDIQLVDEQTEIIYSTKNFIINIDKTAVNNSVIASSSEFDALNKLIATNKKINEELKANEKVRQENESERIENENERKGNEADRQNTESERVNAENVRKANENVRISNENTRKVNETVRQNQEADRQINTAAAIENAEKATKTANDAANDLQHKLDTHHFVLTEDKDVADGVPSLDNHKKVPVAELYEATTSSKGITQLTNSVSSTSTSTAATPNSVKTAYDKAISAANDVKTHNSSSTAHEDIRNLISELHTKLNTLADSDDTTLDQLSEIVAYIKNNKSLIDSITTSKVNVADIIDNLTSTATNKPLSAKQGKVLNDLITALTATVGNKVDKVSGKGLSTNDYTTTEKNKLAGIANGAEVNQNAFSNIAVGSVTITADSKTDTLTIAAGNNITLTADAANDKLIITAKDTTYSTGTASVLGLTKLYTATGTATDGTMTQAAIKSALDGKANASHGNHVPTVQTADNAVFLRNDNTWQTITPTNIGAAAANHTHNYAANSHNHNGAYVYDKANTSGTMNDAAGYRNAMGMINLTNPSSATASYVNPNGQTGWHHFINLSYSEQSGSNMWQTQIANAAGSTDLWVRSRNGAAVDNSKAWAAPWTRILTGSNWKNVITLSSLGAAANTHTHSGYATNEHNHGLTHSNFGVIVADTTTDNGWSMINSLYNGFILKSLRFQKNAPAWAYGDYAAGIAFGGSDTHGVISVPYNSSAVRFAGGNGTKPTWYFSITGTNGKTYNLDTLKVMTGAGTSNGSSGLVPAPTINDKTSFLRGDGKWVSVTAGGVGETYAGSTHGEVFNEAGNIATGDYSHAEGDTTWAESEGSHAEGSLTIAHGSCSHAEGSGSNRKDATGVVVNGTYDEIKAAWDSKKINLAHGASSHVEGIDNIAYGTSSHAEGKETVARGNYSHAEGFRTITGSNSYAHAEGYNTKSLGNSSHTEGSSTEASGLQAHAEGCSTVASGSRSHAEGEGTQALGEYSHAEGKTTKASGQYSHAGGYYTIANKIQYVIGHCNKEASGGAINTKSGSAFIIGNGISNTDRTNAFRVDYSGTVYGLTNFQASGADYSEFLYEWYDGNKSNEDRVGYFVTFKNKKLYKATSNDYIVGIISGNPSVVGNGDEDYYWRYERDEFSRFVMEDIMETVEVTDEETGEVKIVETGNIIKNGRFKQNKNYDPSRQYVERKDRKEWDYVGMLGVLPLRDDGSCVPGQFCKCDDEGIGTLAENMCNGQTFMVLERVNDHVIKVLLK